MNDESLVEVESMAVEATEVPAGIERIEEYVEMQVASDVEEDIVLEMDVKVPSEFEAEVESEVASVMKVRIAEEVEEEIASEGGSKAEVEAASVFEAEVASELEMEVVTILVSTSQDVRKTSRDSHPAITGILPSTNSGSSPKMAKSVRFIQNPKDVGAQTITATM